MTRCENLSLENAESAINQLRERAEAAEKERDKAKIQFGCCSVCGYVAWKEQVVNSQTVEVCQYCELKAKFQPLVDAAREALHLCQIKRVFTSEHHEIDKSQAATWLANALQQWDKSQNQSTNARNIASTPSQTP